MCLTWSAIRVSNAKFPELSRQTFRRLLSKLVSKVLDVGKDRIHGHHGDIAANPERQS